jgi:dTMP kinase
VLITFEGLDGAGKSTQIALLQAWLKAQGIPVSVHREPGGTQLSESIRALLLNPEMDIPPVAEMLLFSAARAALVERVIKPKLQAGEAVIMDRFFDSTTAYQGFGREVVSLEAVHALNKLAVGDLIPDLTVYLKLPIESMESRFSGRKKDRMEQAGTDFFRKVAEGYDQLARGEARFLVIDATQPVETIAQKIQEAVGALLPGKK